MDWGGLLGSMFLGGMAGYGQGALDDLIRQEAEDEKIALMELQNSFALTMQDRENASIEGRETRRLDFESGENKLNRDQQRELAESGFEHAEAMFGKEADLKRGLLDLELGAKDNRSEIGKTVGDLRALGWDDKKIEKFLGGRGGKAGGIYNKGIVDALTLADERAKVRAGITEDRVKPPTEQELSNYQRFYEEEKGKILKDFSGLSEDEGGISSDVLDLFSAKSKKEAEGIFAKMSDSDKAVAANLWKVLRAGGGISRQGDPGDGMMSAHDNEEDSYTGEW